MATIQLPAEQVQSKALEVIEEIMAIRKERSEPWIKRRMEEPVRCGFLWLKKRYLTEQEAINYLFESEPIAFYSAYLYRAGKLEKVGKLLRLSQHGDPVTLNEDDVEVLFHKE